MKNFILFFLIGFSFVLCLNFFYRDKDACLNNRCSYTAKDYSLHTEMRYDSLINEVTKRDTILWSNFVVTFENDNLELEIPTYRGYEFGGVKLFYKKENKKIYFLPSPFMFGKYVENEDMKNYQKCRSVKNPYAPSLPQVKMSAFNS